MKNKKFFRRIKNGSEFNPGIVGAVNRRMQSGRLLARIVNLSLWGGYHSMRLFREFRNSRTITRKRQTNTTDSPIAPTQEPTFPWAQPLGPASRVQLGERILIVAELSLSQCKKYRVDQKVDHLDRLGYQVTVHPWNDIEACRNAMQTHGLVIFYRVPGFPSVLGLADEARRVGIVSYFDVDDLIFDYDQYANHSQVATMPEAERKLLLDGALLYHSMLKKCDHAIGSTPTIVREMEKHTRGRVFLLENCLDAHLLDLAKQPRQPAGEEIIIGYGSGTTTHDIDFKEAASALLQILADYPSVRLAIYGHLNLPAEFERLGERLIRIPFLDPDDYYLSLSRFSINLAPLERGVFNDAKSNIKFLEAALFSVPTVCSPAAAYLQVVKHGENGFVASGVEQWYSALALLIEQPSLRKKVGQVAYDTVRSQYDPEKIARDQLLPVLLHGLPKPKAPATRILLVNILYAPQSFGGATIVVEQLAKHLAAQPSVEVSIFTVSWVADLNDYALARYEWDGIPVTIIKIPGTLTREQDHRHPEVVRAFSDVLLACRPDVVHLHSIQRMGADLATACVEHRIPYVITLHDAWWLCERQFMVLESGKYCAEIGIDPRRCVARKCARDPGWTHRRFNQLWIALEGAYRLLTPGSFHRQLYENSGVAGNKLQINKNGVQLPVQPATPGSASDSRPLVFGYLGGRATHKGYFWLQKIFSEIPESNYILRLVDIEARMGVFHLHANDWKVNGVVEVVPPFVQSELDHFYEGIDVLLFPSQWKESFGLTVREAMVRNVWVVTTDCGGPAEDIVAGENGDIVPMEDAEAYRLAIRRLIQDPMRLSGYCNPHLSKVRGFEEQALELLGILRQACIAKESSGQVQE